MRCSLRIKRSAAKALAALPKADRVRVVDAINLLCDTPAKLEVVPLQILTHPQAGNAGPTAILVI